VRLLLLATLVVAPFGGITGTTAASAGPCLPESYCPPCPYYLVLTPKPHLEQAQC
jgi:hypothetical protein